MNRTLPPFLLLLGVVGALLALNCNNGNEALVEKKVSAAASRFTAHSTATATVLPAPKPEDVRKAVLRIYGDAVQVEDSPSNYLLGDFNGDDSQDLAVRVHPAPGKLAEVNSAVANWILEDPSEVFVPDPAKKVQSFPPKPRQAEVSAGETLLVIVHGFGAEGWRVPEARQTYLLRHAVGTGMATSTKEEAALAQPSSAQMPRLQGDVIQESRDGRKGFLFWTGGHYAWYSR